MTWHERDLSQSASERFIIPESFILIDHMLNSMIRILTGLKVNERQMSENLIRFKEPLMSESVMTALVNKGMPRQEAHKLLQELVSRSKAESKPFSETLATNPTVAGYLSKVEIETSLDVRSYLGASEKLVDTAVERALAERRSRGLT